MSTAKRHLQTEPTSNSFLSDSLSNLSSDRSLPLTGHSSIRNRYRQELEAYRVQREQRVRERMMRLDYVIRNTVEINQIIEKTVMRV